MSPTIRKVARQSLSSVVSDLTVFDIGARFGIHPSLLSVRDLLQHVLVDADDEEMSFLANHYEDSPNVTCIHRCVTSENVVSSSPILRINRYRHPGGNSILEPDPRSTYWSEVRPGTSDILGQISVSATTIDRLADELRLAPQFLKIDVEGHELEVVTGAENCLASSVLGLRVEVLLAPLYRDQGETFTSVKSYLADAGFDFINFTVMTNSYVPFLPWYDDRQPYGRLLGVDAIFFKPLIATLEKSPQIIAAYAIFCMTNGVPDLGIRALWELAKSQPDAMRSLSEDAPWAERVAWLERATAQYLFGLKDRPAMRLESFRDLWREIFGSNWVDHGDFYRRFPIS